MVSPSAFQRLDPVANAGQFGDEGRNSVDALLMAAWTLLSIKLLRSLKSQNCSSALRRST